MRHPLDEATDVIAGSRSGVEMVASCMRGNVQPDWDWTRVVSAAHEKFFSLYLYRALLDQQSASQSIPEVIDYLGELDTANRERNRRLLVQLAEIAAAMNARGIVPIVIKGAAVLLRADNGGAIPRMLRDLDILVDDSDGATAEAILIDLGYAAYPESASSHSLGTYCRGDVVGSVDLHVRLPGNLSEIVPDSELKARVEPWPLPQGMLLLPDNSLHFLINLCHDMLHHKRDLQGGLHLVYLWELFELSRDAARPLDWAWINTKYAVPRLRLALEVQARMARWLFAPGAFPEVGNSFQGGLLHRRRVFHIRHRALANAEWRAIKGSRHLRRILGPRSA